MYKQKSWSFPFQVRIKSTYEQSNCSWSQNCSFILNEGKGKGKVHPFTVLRLCTGRTVHRGSRGIGKVKVHRFTGAEALYKPYGP